MQLLVLGMHRSGTSATAGVLSLMGAHVGPEGSTVPANEQNPKGFFERKELRSVCDRALHAVDAEWWKQSSFDVNLVPSTARRDVREDFRGLVSELDKHQPWVIKEPRLCVLLPLFSDLLTTPVAVIAHRDPIEIAMSLETRNHVPLAAGIGLWEHYVRRALEASADMPRLIVRYRQLIVDPAATVNDLHSRLEDLGVAGLHRPPTLEVRSFVDRELHRERSAADWSQWLTPTQIELASSLEDGSALTKPVKETSSAGQHMLELLEHDLATRREARDLRRRTNRMEVSQATTTSELEESRTVVADLQAELSSVREDARKLKDEQEAASTDLEQLSTRYEQLAARHDKLRNARSVRMILPIATGLRSALGHGHRLLRGPSRQRSRDSETI